jgi:hypothetical protein
MAWVNFLAKPMTNFLFCAGVGFLLGAAAAAGTCGFLDFELFFFS